MMKPTSPCPRPTYRALIAAAAVSSGLLLAACGGGGGGSTPTPPPPPPSGPTPPPPPPPATGVSQADATADAANAVQAGNVSTASADAMFDATAAIAATVAAPSPGARASTMRARPMDGITTVTDVGVNCAGGGTATVTISGVDVTTARNGVFDAGENYSVDYSQCVAATGLPTLTGHVDLVVTSITGGGQNSTTPMTTAVTIDAPNGLAISLPVGTVTVTIATASSATLSRTSLTASGSTTTTSAVTAGSIGLATQFNSRSGTFTITNLNGTRTAVTTNGALASSTYAGTHTVAGTANDRTFSYGVTTNQTVDFDGTGQPTSGDWTAVRSDATIHAVLANGTVVMTVDDGSDGTIDDTWTFPVADLEAAAG